MSWLQPKLHLKVAQKQILTPGLVQMVSVLALNRLELREMINQEMVANPMLEELTDESPRRARITAKKPSSRPKPKKFRRPNPPILSTNSTSPPSSTNIWTAAAENGSGEHEVIEKPSFDKFISSPQGLTEHLSWQLSVTVCNETVREIAEVIIGNLDENGYLTASLEEIAKNGNYSAGRRRGSAGRGAGVRSAGRGRAQLARMPADPAAHARSAECAGAADRFRMHAQAASGAPAKRSSRARKRLWRSCCRQPAQRSCAGAESPGRAGQTRHGSDPQARSASRACATTRRKRGWSSRTSTSARWTTAGRSS